MTAILFDLDGTLIDSVPDLHVALNRVLVEHGHPGVTLQQTRSFVGHGARVLVRRALEAGSATHPDDLVQRAYERFLDVYLDRVCVDTRLYPGAAALLGALQHRGHPLGLVTNKPEAHALAVLNALDLRSAFEVVLGGDSLPTRKPDPAMLHEALERLGASTEDAWLVGDSPVDAQAARRAGVRLALVSFGYSPVPVGQLDPDVVLDHLMELLPLL